MTYATEFIKELQARKLNNFTHKDILMWTDANCSYSVLRDIREQFEKDGYRLIEVSEQRTNTKNETKKFKRYWVEKIA